MKPIVLKRRSKFARIVRMPILFWSIWKIQRAPCKYLDKIDFWPSLKLSAIMAWTSIKL